MLDGQSQELIPLVRDIPVGEGEDTQWSSQAGQVSIQLLLKLGCRGPVTNLGGQSCLQDVCQGWRKGIELWILGRVIPGIVVGQEMVGRGSQRVHVGAGLGVSPVELWRGISHCPVNTVLLLVWPARGA